MKNIRATILLIALTITSFAVCKPASAQKPASGDYLYYYLLKLKAEDKISSDPLIVIDGIAYTYDKVKETGIDLSMNNIYDIACLEKGDARATSIYGEKGKEGVVLIITAIAHDKMISSGHDYKVLFIVGETKLDLDEVYTIDPSDIESTKVIRDKEGIRKYTKRNYDGVVIITLKAGKEFIRGKKYKYN
jgi:bla regulator protein blaR1